MGKVIMLKTVPGSVNGIDIQLFREGENYNLPDSLYEVFKKEKWCRDLVETENFSVDSLNPKTTLLQEKGINSSPNNKEIKGKNKE